MHAPITSKPGHSELSDHPDGILKGVVDGNAIVKGECSATTVLGGFLTNRCVESTMRSGYENGYEVITFTDCIAATSTDEHANAISFDYPRFSKPMTADEVIAQLEPA